MKECDILGGQNTDPSYGLSGGKDPKLNPRIYARLGSRALSSASPCLQFATRYLHIL